MKTHGRLSSISCAVAILLVLTTGAAADEGDSLWSRTFGGSDYDYSYSVIQTDDGGYLLAGMTNSFGAGEYDMWLVKTNAAGDSLWSQTFGGSSADWAESVIQTSDGGYLLSGGTYSFGAGGSDMWLVKTDSAGDSLWSQTFGGSTDDWANAVIQTDDGGYLLAGRTYSFGAGYADMWLVKTNAAGDSLWSQTFGGSDYDYAFSVIQTDDGGYLLAGGTDSFVAGGSDMWLVKTDSAGDSLWSQTFGGSNIDLALSVIQTDDGGYLLAGGTDSFVAGEDDMWLVKTDSAGDSLWSKTFGGSDGDWAFAVIQTDDGGYLLAGLTESFGAGGSDMWLVKTNAAGDSLWSKTFGESNDEYAYSVIQTDDGGYLLAGGTYSFGAGYVDMYLVCVEGPDTTAVEPTPTAFYPLSFILYPCHPNPFNPAAVASFELRVASWVNLRVYDTAGRGVATLVDGWRPAGKHQAIFDGTELPSGIYLARLTAGDFTQTQKLVLLK